MKLKTTVHIHFKKYPWEEQGQFVVFAYKMDQVDHYTYVGEQEIEIEIPDNYDPTVQQIAALQDQKQKVADDFHKTVAEINERISKLQAIEYTA